MSDDTFQIFVSYARNDDDSPPEDLSKYGFVTALHHQLNYVFKSFGDPRPKIWRDTRRIDSAEQFDQKIEEAIDASALLLVVLSPNWLSSAYCRQELKAFTDRWNSDGGNVRERIVVVAKRHVPIERRPSLLQGQVGFQFYALDDAEEVELEREFFVRGHIRDNRYVQRVEELAGVLRRRVLRWSKPREEELIDVPSRTAIAPRKSGKTVFLAKPASDMRTAYDRLVLELRGAGHRIVPEPGLDVPIDSTAEAFLDGALSEADLAVHLLGEKQGYAPDDAEPIVKLQLGRSAKQLKGALAAGKIFKRVIWAPKILAASDGEHNAEAIQRNPLDVLEKFGGYLDTDSVEGDVISRFVELVTQRLDHLAAQQQAAPVPSGNSKVYVCHGPEDIEFAFDVGRALKARDIMPKFPAYEGPSADRVQLHRQHMKDCDSVVLCWASAPDSWIKGTANELYDWKTLGRSKGFTQRALVAGPPPGLPKRMFVEFVSKDEIDFVLDLTSRQQIQPEDFAPLKNGT